MRKIFLLVAVMGALCTSVFAQSAAEVNLALGEIINNVRHSEKTSTVKMRIQTDKNVYKAGEVVSGVIYVENVGFDKVVTYFGTVTKDQIDAVGLGSKWDQIVNILQVWKMIKPLPGYEFKVTADISTIEKDLRKALGSDFNKVQSILTDAKMYEGAQLPMSLNLLKGNEASGLFAVKSVELPKRKGWFLDTNNERPYFYFRFKLADSKGQPFSKGSYAINILPVFYFRNAVTNQVNAYMDDGQKVIFVQ